MNFKIRKISKAPEKQNIPETTKAPEIKSGKKYRISLGLLGSLLIILLLVTGIVKAVSNIDLKVFLKVAGDELKKDAYGHTNFLMLGIGGKNHDGGDLTDTIMVASLDDEDKLVSMVSIPRDIFIKDKLIGNSKINEVYYNAKKYYKNSTQALEYTKSKLEELLGIPIQYYIKIDFSGFKTLIDNLGGIDVNVKKSLYDPLYPKGETTGYEIFSISAGPHHLDGETALKYARSRETTSDFDRADRQQQIIYAIKQKALETKTILNAGRISDILNTLKDNIETNISSKELLTLGSLAPDYSADKIIHRLLHDDPTRCGGFLYTPSKEFYGGMFVLVPAGSFSFVNLYADLIFNNPKIAIENSRLQILNGTKKGGVAGETKQILQRFCFNITRFGNANNKKITQTTYYYQQKLDKNGKAINSRPESLNFLEKLIPGKESTQIPQIYVDAGYDKEADIILEIGSDYVDSDKYMKDPYYSLPELATPKAPTTTGTTAATPGTKPGTAVKTTTPPPSNHSLPPKK